MMLTFLLPLGTLVFSQFARRLKMEMNLSIRLHMQSLVDVIFDRKISAVSGDCESDLAILGGEGINPAAALAINLAYQFLQSAAIYQGNQRRLNSEWSGLAKTWEQLRSETTGIPQERWNCPAYPDTVYYPIADNEQLRVMNFLVGNTWRWVLTIRADRE